MHMFTRAAIAAAMFCGVTTSASAAQIVDQSNQGAVDREFQNMFTLGQSFTPTGTSIDFASFMIRATGTARMTAIVYAGGGFDGRLLGTSDAITVDTTYAMKQFTFAPIALVPSQLYTLRLSSSTGTFRARASADTYARGLYYGGSGFAAANIDLLFAEGFTVVPEPASWAMLVMGFGMMAGAARHHRRLGNATTD